MRVRIERRALAEAWALVSGAAEPRRAASPVLRCVRLRASGGMLTLAATDGEVCAQAEAAGAEVTLDGEALVDAANGRAILQAIEDREITLTADGNVFVVGADSRTSFEMPSQDPASWPEPPADDGGGREVESDVLANLLEMAGFAAAEGDGAVPACRGVALYCAGEALLAAATDGKRLAVAGVDRGGGRPALVPERAVRLLSAHLSGLPAGTLVSLEAGEAEIACHRPGASLRARLLSGRFPDWRTVMPRDEPAGKGVVNAKELAAAVKQAAIMADADDRRLSLAFSRSGLVLEASSRADGRSRVPLPLAYEGADVALCLDHKFLTDFLRAAKGAELSVEVRAADRPVVLRRGPEWTYVVMPMTAGGG